MKLHIDNELLQVSVNAAIEAGENAYNMKEHVSSDRKNNGDLVTKADKQSESIAREVLLESDLVDNILGEEHGGSISDERHAIIDPIDGTENYSFQNPIYGSSVGIVEDNTVICGAFYMPEFDYLYYAMENRGAYRNDVQLEITGNRPHDRLVGISGGQPITDAENLTATDFMTRIKTENYRLQKLGSAVASSCWVASEWMSAALIGSRLHPWDTVVGKIVVNEAGGILKNVKTGETDWHSVKDGNVIVGDQTVADNILSIL